MAFPASMPARSRGNPTPCRARSSMRCLSPAAFRMSKTARPTSPGCCGSWRKRGVHDQDAATDLAAVRAAGQRDRGPTLPQSHAGAEVSPRARRPQHPSEAAIRGPAPRLLQARRDPDQWVVAGAVLAQAEVAVESWDTGASLYARLEDGAARLLSRCWPRIVAARWPGVPQSSGGTTHRVRDFQTLDRYDLNKHPEARRFFDLLRARSFPPH